MLKYVFKTVLELRRDDMEFIAQRVDKDAIKRLEDFINSDFAQVDYTDAVEILKTCGKKFEYPVEWGIDLQSEHERYLAEEHFKSPVVVKNYPKDIKAFYMKINDDGKTVAAMDVLAPGIGEIIGGSQREDRLGSSISVLKRWVLTRMLTGGIAICAAMALYHTQASA